MTSSSRRLSPDYNTLRLLEKVIDGLAEIVGDLTGEVQVPDDPDELSLALELLGQVCLVAHKYARLSEPPEQDILSALNKAANVMGYFELDIDVNHISECEETLLHIIDEAATGIDAYLDVGDEYLKRHVGDEIDAPLRIISEALERRRRVEFCRVSLEEMGRCDDVPDLTSRLKRFDEYYSRRLAPLRVKLDAIPGLPESEDSWWTTGV